MNKQFFLFIINIVGLTLIGRSQIPPIIDRPLEDAFLKTNNSGKAGFPTKGSHTLTLPEKKEARKAYDAKYFSEQRGRLPYEEEIKERMRPYYNYLSNIPKEDIFRKKFLRNERERQILIKRMLLPKISGLQTYHRKNNSLDTNFPVSKNTGARIPLQNTAASVTQGDRVTDSLALIALYNSTAGANWTNKWDIYHAPMDNWYGVTLSDGRVSVLSYLIPILTAIHLQD